MLKQKQHDLGQLEQKVKMTNFEDKIVVEKDKNDKLIKSIKN